MYIKYNLTDRHKKTKTIKNVNVDLYRLASELYEELDKMGIIDRLKQVTQLGSIKVAKKLEKKRYEYVVLQLYLHQLIKKEIKNCLKYTYNNQIKGIDYESKFVKFTTDISIMDLVQILTLIYNIGHYYNTFVSSRAVTMLAANNRLFRDVVINSFEDDRYTNAALKILTEHNYQRVHLLNVLSVLERCDKGSDSVQVAKEIILAYINEEKLAENSKVKYAFDIFRIVRNIAFISYDL